MNVAQTSLVGSSAYKLYKVLLEQGVDTSEIDGQTALVKVVDSNRGVRDYVKGATGWSALLMNPLYRDTVELIKQINETTADETVESSLQAPAYDKNNN